MFTQYAEDARRGAFEVGAPTNHVKELTGRDPEGFESIARRYLADPGLVRRGLTTGSKVGAILGLVKMMLTRVTDFDRWEAERGHAMLSGSQFAPDDPEWMASAQRQTLALLEPGAEDQAPVPGSPTILSA
jgi:hypothetical protein